MNNKHLKQLDLLNSLKFDYNSLKLNTEDRLFIQQKTVDIKLSVRRSCQEIIAIGKALQEIKAKLGHGYFREWLQVEFIWSLSLATKFMQVYEQFKKVNFTHLNFSPSALYLLSAPSTSQQARQEALEKASQGEKITYTLAKKIKTKYKQINLDKSLSYPDSNPELTLLNLRDKIEQNIVRLSSFKERKKILEIDEINSLYVLLEKEWGLAKRQNYEFSLIFIFYKEEFLDKIYKSNWQRIRFLYNLAAEKNLKRLSDYLLSLKSEMFDIAILSPSNKEGTIALTHHILASLTEVNQNLLIDSSSFFHCGNYKGDKNCSDLRI